MTHFLRKTNWRRSLSLAFVCALCLTLLLPAVASAHAILLSSNPTKDALLNTSPSQVQMWFSEDLNPALSTAQVVNSSRQRVDTRNAHINPDNSKEMDLSLPVNLPPDVYIVVWRTDSADDGHVLLGSFLFTVKAADGTIPTLSAGSNPGAGLLGGSSASATGTLDWPGVFTLVSVTLVELLAIFWVGAQFWLHFVLHPSSEKY